MAYRMGMLDQAPPIIAEDIYANGIMLTGGCVHMPGMAEALARKTALRITVAQRPEDTVVCGLGLILQYPCLWNTRISNFYCRNNSERITACFQKELN